MIRDFRGEKDAGELLASLKKEARQNGIILPDWTNSGAETGLSNNRYQLARTVDYTRYDKIIHKAARIYGLQAALIKAVIHAESSFYNHAVSHKGAQGLMQLMPETAKELGVNNPFNPRANIFGGSKLLKKHLNEFGSLKKALIAYNAGPDYVRAKRRIPRETRIYIRRVIKHYQTYERKGFNYADVN